MAAAARLRCWLVALCLLAGWTQAAPPPAALAGKRVLYLSPYSSGRSGIDLFNRTFVAAMTDGGLNGEDILLETLNLDHEMDPVARQLQRALLRHKYQGQRIDLIVALQQPALEYALNELREVAPGAPILSVNSESPGLAAPSGRLLLQQSVNADFRGTLAQALLLFPDTRRVLVTLGSGEADQALKREVERQAAGWTGRLLFEYTDRLDLAALYQRVAQLPPHSLIINASYNRDANGKAVVPTYVARQVALRANAPVFALYDVALLPGIVGGSVLHLEREATRLAQAALALLSGREAAARALVSQPSAGLSLYDWRELQRWGADPSRLPPDTVFLHRPPSLWGQHRDLVLLGGGVIVMLSALLALLLLQRRRLLSARARSRESEERYRMLVENAAEAIVVYDADLERLVDCNGKAEQLFGYPRVQLLSIKLVDLYVDALQQGAEGSVMSNALRTLGGEDMVFERTVRARDGRCFPCEVRLVRLPAVGRRLTRGSYAEISERKRAEQELLQHRNQLEHLVQQRTAALSVALRDAESANRAKSVFLANMSHELRTPLNSVIGFSQMMAEAGTADHEDKRNLDIINRAGHHLLSLINDILELSKIEAGQAQLQLMPLDLDQLLHEVLDMVHMRAAAKGIVLALDCSGAPPRVLADGAKLRQVLLNLLSNAVKFVEQGSVTLALQCGSRADGQLMLTFSVRDTGIGIAEADQQRIFEPFVQVDAGAARAGTGLGLAISHEFVRLMGGQLTVRSLPGAGADFGFSVLARPAAMAAVAAPSRARVAGLLPQHHGLVVLVADDHDDGRKLLSDLLAPLGFLVPTAADAGGAMAALAAGRVDLVLLDWRMPGMDGLDLTRWIRAQAGLRQPRIVMLTASAFEEEKQQALAAGADDFLRKPVEADKLFAVLEQQLDLHFVRREVLHAGAPPAPATAPDPAELDCLPAPQRAALLAAVRELDSSKAGAILAALDPGCAALAPRLQAMLDSHQYRQLWQLLQASAPDGAAVP